MDKIKKLLSLCKASVTLQVNKHIDYYDTVEQYLKEEHDIDNNILSEMIKRNTVIEIQAYTLYPIGFHVVYHYDIDLAIEEMINILEN